VLLFLMKKTLLYLFDPLCGWCYGATPALARLLESDDVVVELLPTGLFSSDGVRPMDDEFAAYAWANDRRIERLTGQRFSERYRAQVLGDRQRPFDSGPATLMLTAVSLTEPTQELEALKAIQFARFVDGRDVTSLETLADVLRANGLASSVDRLEHSPSQVLERALARVELARKLMREVVALGVPAFIAEDTTGRRLLHASTVFGDPQTLSEQLATA
jgi:putative protein-disulfide isomerase